jgi:hypothetical protein
MPDMTAKQMIEEFNSRHPERAMKVEWKASKDSLRARLDEMEAEFAAIEAERRAAEPEPKQSEPGSRGSIGRMVEHLLTSGASYAGIVRLVREQFPEARTTAKSVASVACALRKKGVPVATRRAKA